MSGNITISRVTKMECFSVLYGTDKEIELKIKVSPYDTREDVERKIKERLEEIINEQP